MFVKNLFFGPISTCGGHNCVLFQCPTVPLNPHISPELTILTTKLKTQFCVKKTTTVQLGMITTEKARYRGLSDVSRFLKESGAGYQHLTCQNVFYSSSSLCLAFSFLFPPQP